MEEGPDSVAAHGPRRQCNGERNPKEEKLAKWRKTRRLEQEETDYFIRSHKETQLADFLMPEEILTGPYCSDPDEMRKANESMAELFKDVQETGEELLKEYEAKVCLEIPTGYTLPPDLRAPTSTSSKH